MSDHSIYLDYASTTPIDPKVLEAMLPYFEEKYGNAESHHKKGQEAKIAIDKARETIAKILNCQSREIIFCSTATEANNFAIFGCARANKSKGKHLITSLIEHSSVREPFKKLEEEGFEVTYLEVDKEGFINPQDLETHIRPNTTFVSIMQANNEIGTIEPTKELAEICKKHGVIFHTDACQSAGTESIDTQELQVDLITINGSKIYGPKGIGVLYIKNGTKIDPLIYGSNSHERGLRAGTHNVPTIVGMAKALELIQQNREQENKKLKTLRNRLIDNLLASIPHSHLNGPREKRLPNNVNISIDDINSQELMLLLDEAGIYVSTGAACNVGTISPSNTLRAIGLSPTHLHSSIRMTMGKYTNIEDIDYVIKTLPKVVEKLRMNS